jgi:hypothetical protein
MLAPLVFLLDYHRFTADLREQLEREFGVATSTVHTTGTLSTLMDSRPFWCPVADLVVTHHHIV